MEQKRIEINSFILYTMVMLDDHNSYIREIF